MPKIIENEIEFNFIEETVLKYDDSSVHKQCKSYNKKGVDFLYKFNSNLFLIEVKDYDTDLSSKNSKEKEKVLKDRDKSLEINKQNSFDMLSFNIEQKFNDTLLNLFSSTLINKIDLKPFLVKTKTITLILIIDLPYALEAEAKNIERKFNEKLEKIKCLFNLNFLLLNSNSELKSFQMKRVSPTKKENIKPNINTLYIYDS
ncbi:MAG: Unknown protein, partial [uncultured Sulfurovum sp.]